MTRETSDSIGTTIGYCFYEEKSKKKMTFRLFFTRLDIFALSLLFSPNIPLDYPVIQQIPPITTHVITMENGKIRKFSFKFNFQIPIVFNLSI